MKYEEFLDTKKLSAEICGFDARPQDFLFDFQRAIVKWALKRGRSAIFADTGLGKTAMELAWAQQVNGYMQGNVLIVAPLCVAQQTVREGQKLGVTIQYVRHQNEVDDGIYVTNYEMLDCFDLSHFAGIALDESSILKHHTSKTRTAIIESCQQTPYRLSCTATPSPNDFMELGNQSEFLGIMSRTEMLAMFFTHDGGETSKWRLKGHGKRRFWEWLSTWAVCIKSPSDIGFADDKYRLPHVNTVPHEIECEPTDSLFVKPAVGLLERNRARRNSVEERASRCADLVNGSDEKWIVWCHLNDESSLVASLVPGSVEIKGSDSRERKEQAILDFIDGDTRVLVSKPSIFGFGLNLQHCRNMAFVSVTDSWEEYYQSVRRCHRFGQKNQVNVHLFYSQEEGAIIENIKRKESQNQEMSAQMVQHMKKFMEQEIFGAAVEKSEYEEDVRVIGECELRLGDCVNHARQLESDSVGYTIFSPPFASLYTYSNSDYDMGNCRDDSEFYDHFKFLISEMYRITMPGRLLSFHCMNLPTSKQNHGYIGIRDFRGELIRLFVDAGWIFHSEVVIWKDPVTAMQRTKALGLLHKQIKKDSAMSRQGIPDYLVTMRKPGDNPVPVSHTAEEFPVSLWQRYASPVWMDINPSKTLNGWPAREDDDERHICPLQLEVIERGLELWSAPGDIVFSPFAGIGSEGFMARKMGRRFIGVELKRSYFELACQNIESAKMETADLFS